MRRLAPADEDALTKISEFIRENPNIFEQLGRLFKGKRKEETRSSKCRSEYFPQKSPDRRSVTKYSRREPLAFHDKKSSKVRGISKVLSRGIYEKMDAHPPHKEPNPGSCNRAPPFIPEINEDPLLICFKLVNIPRYDEKNNPENHVRAFYTAFYLYQASDSFMCHAFPVFL